ncbi:MAG: LPS export ABC transporter permease LptF [Pseudomonadota bacterium]|nr:LPS export ABC transporter permease LptF [Pseudomonadota bacterium]
MRRFERALTREMAEGAAVGFAALVAIFSVVILVRTLSKAVAGDLDVDAIMPMLGFGVLRTLPVLLSLGLFVGVFMSLSRLWRDSEAVIWMNGGVGPWGWIWPVLLFVMPVVLIIAFVSLEGIAWGARKQAEFEQVLAAKDQFSTLAPGVFSEDRHGKRVVFVERISHDGGHVENVFVQSFERGRMGVTVASQGLVRKMDNGDTFLVLEQGKRYEGVPGAADFWMAKFKSYSVRIPEQAVAARSVTARTMTTADLIRNPAPVNMGEWVWRLGYPISALLLCLLAVPLSYSNPRAGGSLNVAFTVLIYLAYNNFVGLSKGWVERSTMGATESLLLVHGLMLLVLLAMFWRRFRGPWTS